MVVHTYVERNIPFHCFQHMVLAQRVPLLRVIKKKIYIVINIHAVKTFYVCAYISMLNVLKVYVPVSLIIIYPQSHMLYMYS